MGKNIYQNGFYLLLGIFFGVLSTFFTLTANTPKEIIKVKIIHDTVFVQPSQEKPVKLLTEANLKEELLKHNIPHAPIVLAQAKLESGNFKSKLTQTHQNIFGLKKGNKYRKYNHWTECVLDYKKYISNRYKGGDYYQFLENINYATNPNYTKLLKNMI